MRYISKPIFLNAVACPTLAWFQRHDRTPPEPSESERFLLEQGREIGLRARRLFPDGALVEDRDFSAAVEVTRRLLADPGVGTIFEAAFRAGDCVARVDILSRVGDAWRVVEVKSGTSANPRYLRDLAYTTMVVAASGLPLASSALALVSRDYRLGMGDARLFVFEDCTLTVRNLVSALGARRTTIEALTAGSRPAAELKKACRECPYFASDCLGVGEDHHVLDLPRLTENALAKLTAAGIRSISAIPSGFGLTPAQERIRASVVAARPWVSSTLRADLESVSWPACYLDFETVSTAIPLYPEIAPYAQIPFQYSLHKRSAPGATIEHRDFLADPRRDPRRDLIERLLADLGTEGSVFVYTSFEKTVLNSLADRFPDLRGDVEGAIARMVDLNAILQKHYYHPDFRGSYSIKVALPVLVPDLSYDGLAIADGSAASAAFARMAHGVYDAPSERKVCADLREYCGRDTMAMVRLHEAMARLS